MTDVSPPHRTATIVLAAGRGRRLLPAHDGPKWLAPLGDGRVIADVHRDGIRQSPLLSSGPVLVVTGHDSASIERYVTDPRFRILVNHQHSERDNWYSLLLALDHVEGTGWDGPVLVLNSDLVLPPEWLGDLAASLDDPVSPAQLVVDTERDLTHEAMKVGLDAHGTVVALGKTGVTRPVGEYIGLAGLPRQAWHVLLQVLRDLARGPFDGWYEEAMIHAVDRGLTLVGSPAPSSRTTRPPAGAASTAAGRHRRGRP